MRTYLQKSASIQPRTSPVKFAQPEEFWDWGSSRLLTEGEMVRLGIHLRRLYVIAGTSGVVDVDDYLPSVEVGHACLVHMTAD